MQACTHCGKQNKEDLRFCGHCGQKLSNACPSCDFKNLPYQEFCGNCGKQLSDKDNMAAMTHLQQQPPPTPTHAPAATAPAAVPQAAVAVVDLSKELDEFALLSVEYTNFSKLDGASDDPREVERFRQQCVSFVERQALTDGGRFKLVKDNIYFVSFRHEPTVEDSVKKATQTALTLLAEDFKLKDIVLSMRIGLDIDQSNNPDSITATTERTIATPGDLVTSERVGRILAGLYKTKTIGPMLIGGEPRRFSRVSPLGPDPVSELLPPETVSTDPILKPVITEADLMKMTRKAKEEKAAAAEPIAAPAAELAPPAAAVPEPATPPSTEAVTAAPPMPQVSLAQKVSETSKPSGYKELGKVKYELPEFGVRKATRLSNMTYRQTVDALANEFNAHIKGMPNCKVISISGTDGLGKSHIIQMARQQADPENTQATWMGAIHYRAFADNPWPLRTWLDLLENLLGMYPEGMPQDAVQSGIERFLQLVYEGKPPAVVSACMQDLFVTPNLKPLNVESRTRIGRVEKTLVDLFKQIASRKPVIIVLEDILFADPASMSVLATLLESSLFDGPFMLVLTHSRDFHLTGELGDAVKKHPGKEYSVSDLSETDMETFMNEGPLGGNIAAFPVSLIDRMVGNAHGLPLQMEEVLRLLYLQDVLSIDEQTGKFIPDVDVDVVSLNVPAKTADIIQQRTSMLADNSRYALQLASVIGERFPITLLMNLLQLPQDEFNTVLNNLFDHGFLIPDAVSTGRFRHGLIWQSVYTGIDPGIRTQLHQLVSQTLENDFKNGITVNPALMAWHSEMGQLPNRAFTYRNLAGIHMAQVGALEGFNMAMFRAVDILQGIPKDTETRETEDMELKARIYENLGLFNMDSNPPLAVALLEWVLKYRSINKETAKMIETLGFLAACYEQEGNYPQALATINKNLTLFSKTDYPLEYASLLVSKMEYLFAMGRLAEAKALYESEIALLYENQPLEEEPDHFNTCLNGRLLMAQILLAQCDSRCFPLIEESLAFSREHGWEGLTIALELCQSRAYLKKGQYEACDQGADNLLNRIEALAEPDWFLAQWGLLAMMYHCELGDWNNAQQLVLSIVSKSEAVQDYQTWLLAQNYAARIHLGTGNVPEAVRILEKSVETSAEFRIGNCALHGWRWLAEAEAMAGNNHIALEVAENALKVASAPDVQNHYERFLLTTTLARCLVDSGDAANITRAGKLLETLWPEVARTGFKPVMAHTLFAIGHLYKKLATGAPSEASKKHLLDSVKYFQKAQGLWLEMGNKFMLQVVREATPKI